MTESTSQRRHDRQTDATLAELFDTIPPHNRREAEDELRTVDIDPAAIAFKTEQLVARLGLTLEPAPTTGAARARWRNRRALGWSIAATVVLSIAATLVASSGDARRIQRWLPRPRSATPQLPSTAQTGANRVADTDQVGSQDDAAPQVTPVVSANDEMADSAGALDSAPSAAANAPLSFAPPVANVRTGQIVNAATIDQHLSALPPGIEWAVRRGMRLPVVGSRPIHPPRAYREATERYSGQTRLGSDGLSLQNYVAGLPFVHIDPNDPQVAVKIMWNYAHNFFATDDVEAANIEADSGLIGHGPSMHLERHFVIERFRRLFFTGRLFVDTRPELRNPEGIRYREAYSPITQPADLKGVGLISIRYLSATKPDDTWLYLPDLRRVRRISSKERSEPWFRQDADADSFFGFNGQIASADFRFLGEAEVLACMHAEHDPVQWGVGSADFAFDDVWEVRPVYVVEAAYTQSEYTYGKRVLFIDKEAWVIPFSDIYDRSGELLKVWINMFSTRPIATATAPWAEGDELLTLPASVVIDVQREHATRITVPSASADSPGWRFNEGERRGLTEEWFKIAALIERGH